jgi:segregation and condensation protein B
VLGRKKVVGRPFLYGTTREFLIHFGLKDLSEMPQLQEFEELIGEKISPDVFHSAPPDQAEMELIPEPPEPAQQDEGEPGQPENEQQAEEQKPAESEA